MTIYKYLNEEGAIATIKDNTVLLRTPPEYNDPFDCVFHISEKERKKAYKLLVNYEYFKAIYNECVIANKQYVLGKCNTKLLKTNLNVLANTIRANKKYKFDPYISFHYKVGKILTGKSVDSYWDDFNKIVDEVLENVRHMILLSCFSFNYDSILMWSHYAKSHFGACVKYEIDDDNFKPIHYSKKPINFKISKLLEIKFGHEFAGAEMDYKDEAFLFALKPFLNKYIDWQYEDEIRCAYSINIPNSRIHEVIINKNEKALALDMPAKIQAVYLGYNATDEFIDKVKKSCGKIPLFKMEKGKQKYLLIPTKLD